MLYTWDADHSSEIMSAFAIALRARMTYRPGCVKRTRDECREGKRGMVSMVARAAADIRTVLEKQVDEHDRHEEHDGLERGKVEREILVHGPGNDDQKGNHTSGDLDAGSDSNANSQLHLALAGHPHGSDVLRRVADLASMKAYGCCSREGGE